MYHWFSPHTGEHWTPDKGYNTTFAQVIRDLREQFGLTKQRPGFEKGTGRWTVFTPAHTNEPVAVKVEWLDWSGYDYLDGYTTPVFKFKIVVASTDPSTRRTRLWDAVLRRESDVNREVGRVLFQHDVIMVFPSDFPSRPPRFRVDSVRYRARMASHEHHLYDGGWMCIFEYGEWDSRRSTVLTAWNVAVDWMVWHYSNFDW